MNIKGLACGLVAALMAAASAPGSAEAQSPTKTISDSTNYFSGSWTAYIAPFNKGSLVYGRDYTEANTFSPATFPDGSLLTWSWPSTPATGVYDFNSVQFGNYACTHPPVPIPSMAIGDINTLRVSHQFSISGTLTGFDSIIDIFLTQQAGGDNAHEYEVEVFLHTPPYSVWFVTAGVQVGTVLISGVNWTVATQNDDILFMPASKEDLMAGEIDIKAMFDYLIIKGVVAKTVFFNGLAYGTETKFGAGAMKIRHLDVTYN